MIARLLVSLLCIAFTSGASASICDALARAQHFEAQLLSTDNGSRPFDLRTLAAVRRNADALSRYYVSDPRLAKAVAAYVANVTALRTNPAGHATPAHLGLLRHIEEARYSLCAPPIRSSDRLSIVDATGTNSDKRARLIAVDLSGVVPVAGFAVSILGFATLLITALLRRRQARLTRHHCYLDIEVTTGGSAFPTQMVDISASGAKIRLPEAVKLTKTLSLNFQGQSHLVRLAWQNTHFAGVTFKRPLAAHLIRRISKGIQREPKLFARSAEKRRAAQG